MHISSSLHDVSKNPDHISHILQIEVIIFDLIIVPFFSYVLRCADHDKGHLFTRIFSDARLVLLCHIFKVHVLNGAQRSNLLEELVRCSSPVFSRGER